MGDSEPARYEYGDQLTSLADVEDGNWDTTQKPRPKLVPVKAIKANPEHITKFQHACDQRGIMPFFEYVEPLPYQFTATVRLDNQIVDSGKAFPNKKLAKEAVCERALPVAEALPISVASRKKRRASEAQFVDGRIDARILNETNWISTLQEYCQGKHIQLPEYEEYQTPTSPYAFACEVKLVISGIPILGSRTDPYPSKALARKAAAREAVMWLDSQGEELKRSWIETPAMQRQRREAKSSAAMDEDTSPNQQSTPQCSKEVDANNSVPQQVVRLAISLGFSPPAYTFLPSALNETIASANGWPFVDVHATFTASDVRKEPSLSGQVGKVTKIFGRKKGKELCASQVLGLLEAVKQSRT